MEVARKTNRKTNAISSVSRRSSASVKMPEELKSREIKTRTDAMESFTIVGLISRFIYLSREKQVELV